MSRERASALALVAFMRSEADAAEQKAKSFRFQAEQLAQSFGISRDIQQRYGTWQGLGEGVYLLAHVNPFSFCC